MTYDAFVQHIRTFHATVHPPKSYDVCGLCGDPFLAFAPKVDNPCGHAIHASCHRTYPNSQTCGHCVDEMNEAGWR